jgi:uncharacterized protein YjbI with pentapeptide repeats
MRKVTQEEFDKMATETHVFTDLILNGVDVSGGVSEGYNRTFFNCRINESGITTESKITDSKLFNNFAFINCFFYRAVFNECVFNDVVFIDCRLMQTEFKNCQIKNSKILGSDLDCAVFSSILFDDCDFIHNDLNGAHFNNCELSCVTFVGCENADKVKGVDLFQFTIGKYRGHYYTGHIKIGCRCYPVGYWLKNYKEIGEREELEDEDIELYGTIIKYIANLYPRHAESIQIDTEESDTDLIAPILSMQSLLEEGKPLHGIANIWDDNQLDEKSVAHNGYSKSHGDWVENSYPRPNPDEQ